MGTKIISVKEVTEESLKDAFLEEKNPAHYCMGMDCREWIGHRGWCSEKCYNSSYPTSQLPSCKSSVQNTKAPSKMDNKGEDSTAQNHSQHPEVLPCQGEGGCTDTSLTGVKSGFEGDGNPSKNPSADTLNLEDENGK